jgi:hypothetical protein
MNGRESQATAQGTTHTVPRLYTDTEYATRRKTQIRYFPQHATALHPFTRFDDEYHNFARCRIQTFKNVSIR